VTDHVSFEEIRQLFRATDERIDRRMQETDRRLKALGEQIGGLGNRLGEFVEGAVRPSLVRLFRERGLDVHQTFRDLPARNGDAAAQIDLLVIDDTVGVAVEVESKLSAQAVDDHVERLDKFRELFPRFADLRVHGAVAAMVIDPRDVEYAVKHGMFVIGQAGDDAVILNAPEFEPRVW
jgi:hypothetical protein